ncbi:collagen alpha-1(XXVII) chain-like isoform X2 [Orbicella faveolata]|uniref:collagen alpha-1(XXVII) chain-like isoform X2 n=1 Tax=Orbicella faveolata TaxID=48498 RepID=UPI0009E56393|nr:collagen alpha-1(XXVII) chain-like isoform X2 [Orbicella faveolata]
MFRSLTLLVLVFTLRSFASSQNNSTNKVSSNGTQQNPCRQSSSKECCARDGRDGRDGQNGKDGRDGRDGRNGVKGEKGEQGICHGNNGINGPKGETGEQVNGCINCTKGDKGEHGLRGNDGKNGTKGQKGEPGSSAKSTNGTMQFTETADNCTLHTAGTVRYNTSQKALELCDGSAWLPLVTARTGHVASNPGRHCLDILNSGHSHGSGLYWIDPNGASTDDSFQALCDMETEGGGWTLVATKVSPSFPFIKTAFSTLAAKTTNADAASHIHPDMGDWEEVMFRFADINTIRVIYNRKAGAPQNAKKEFEKFLMGTYLRLIRTVYGFYKYSPADHNKRNPSVGFATISRWNFYTDLGISEWYGGTDKWLDMWNGGESSNNYVTADDSKAVGTKCIAGYCYLNKPIWVMVR